MSAVERVGSIQVLKEENMQTDELKLQNHLSDVTCGTLDVQIIHVVRADVRSLLSGLSVPQVEGGGA